MTEQPDSRDTPDDAPGELEEQAQIAVDAAVKRIRELGFGLLADGTVHGDGIWIGRLRVRRICRTVQND